MSATFLDVIWPNKPDLFGEIRAIDPGSRSVLQYFIRLDDDRGRTAEEVGQDYQGQGLDVYFGVLPRTHRGGGAADVRSESDILWADIDAKHFNPDLGIGKRGALAALRLGVVPQILVDSGGGYHAYWLLDRSIDFDYAQVLMKGIARVAGGDAVYDRPRVLRLPGTLNRKREPLVEARILRFDLVRTYKPGDFDDLVVVNRTPRTEAHPFVPTAELPDWLLDLIKTGAPVGERSELAFKVCLWLVRFGRTDEEVEMVFQSTPDGIGAKYAEKKSGPRWLAYTLKAARERA